MSPKSIEAIGPAGAERLGAAGITTVEQLADADAASRVEQTVVADGSNGSERAEFGAERPPTPYA